MSSKDETSSLLPSKKQEYGLEECNSCEGHANATNDVDVSYPFLNIFYFNIFFACASFSIVMPSLAPYLIDIGSDLSFLAWVVGIYAFGEIAGSIFFGWYYEYSLTASCWQEKTAIGPRSSLLGCIAVGIIGSAMYVAADIYKNPWLIFWARFVQGIWTGGQQTTEQAYLNAAVAQEKKVELTSSLSTFAVLGFVLGPSFGALFTSIDTYVFGLHINAYNAPGYFILFITMLMMFVTFMLFDGKDDLSMQKRLLREVNSEKDAENNYAAVPEVKRNYLGLMVCMGIFFIHYYNFSVQETVITPLVMHLYEWSLFRINLLFVGFGIISLITSISLKYLSRKFDDRSMLLCSIFVGLVGSALLIDGNTGNANKDGTNHGLSLTRFLVGFSLITVAFPFGRTVTLGIFSNVLGSDNQGLWMGFMLATSAIPRVFGPFLAMYSLEVVNWRTWLEFGSIFALFLVGLLIAIAAYQTLVPFPEGGTNIERYSSPYIYSPYQNRERRSIRSGDPVRKIKRSNSDI